MTTKPLRPRPDPQAQDPEPAQREHAVQSSRFVVRMPPPMPGVTRTAILVVNEDSSAMRDRLPLDRTLSGIGPEHGAPPPHSPEEHSALRAVLESISATQRGRAASAQFAAQVRALEQMRASDPHALAAPAHHHDTLPKQARASGCFPAPLRTAPPRDHAEPASHSPPPSPPLRPWHAQPPPMPPVSTGPQADRPLRGAASDSHRPFPAPASAASGTRTSLAAAGTRNPAPLPAEPPDAALDPDSVPPRNPTPPDARVRARSRGTRNAILTVWGAVAVSAGVYWVTCAVINGVPEDGKPGSPLATAAAAAIDIKPRTKPASELRPKPRSSQLYAAASGIAAAHNALANAAPSALRVDTVAAVLRPMPRYLTLTGTLTADLESNVAADAAGKVLEVSVDRGSNVQTGDILVVLDRRAADINSREATAAVEIARVHSELARTNCARADALLKQGAIGQVDYDRAKSECTATQLAVAAAQSRRAAALKSLDDALIRAPFAGVVSERFVEPGEYVQPQSQVAHLVASDPLRLRMSVPEQLVGSIETDMLVELQVAAHAERWFAGKVRYLSAALREDTRDLIVEAEVPNPEQQLRPGMFAVARVVLPKHPVTAVPEASLRYDGELARLFVAQAGHLEERIVELGTRDAQWVEIRRGVALGEAVVSPFSLEAKDGTPVAQ